MRIRSEQYFRTAFERLHTDAYALKDLCRLHAGGKVFFFCRGDLDNPELPDALPAGAEIFIGARAFDDGTFWLYWLHAPGHGTAAQPSRNALFSRFFLLLLPLGLALAGGWRFVLSSPHIWKLGFWGILGTALLLLVGICAFCFAAHSLVFALSPRHRRLNTILAAVLRGDVSACSSLEEAPPASPLVDEEKELAAELALRPAPLTDSPLYQADGAATAVKARYYSTGTGKYAQYYIEYAFICVSKPLIWTIHDDSALFHPADPAMHPFMLAEGDRVRAVVKEDGVTVQGLRNYEDGCVYLHADTPLLPRTLKKFSLLLGMLLLGMIVLGAAIELTEFERPDPLFILFFGGIALGGCLLVFLCMYLSFLWGRRRSAARGDTLLMLTALGVAGGSREAPSPYLHEI